VGGNLRRFLPALVAVPFLLYLLVFLIEPTIEVAVGAFQDADGAWTLDSVRGLTDGVVLKALWQSVYLSSTSAVLGAVLGAVLAAVVVAMPDTSFLRRWILGLAGVFAQFGGVTLAFLFIATFGTEGFVTTTLAHMGLTADSSWIFTLNGLVVVYLYFQIPLMVIVFTPAVEGLRTEWREAATNLGATRRQYLAQVAIPILRPAFLGALLLLFTNAFAAYATAAALIAQGWLILPMGVRNSLHSEVTLGHQHLAYALALEMIVVVALVMAAYAWLMRRSRSVAR
jgi:putative spermidine/putrescine transport system permease protein